MKASIVALANKISLSPFSPASIEPSIVIDPTQKIKLAEIKPSANLSSYTLMNFSFMELAKLFNFPSRSNSSPTITPSTREIIGTIMLPFMADSTPITKTQRGKNFIIDYWIFTRNFYPIKAPKSPRIKTTMALTKTPNITIYFPNLFSLP